MTKKSTKSIKRDSEGKKLLLVAAGALLLGIVLGELDAWIAAHKVTASEILSVAFMMYITLAVVYAWYAVVLSVRLFSGRVKK